MLAGWNWECSPQNITSVPHVGPVTGLYMQRACLVRLQASQRCLVQEGVVGGLLEIRVCREAVRFCLCAGSQHHM